MKLMSSAASPFARKVAVLLHETGQIEDVEVVQVATTPLATNPGLAAANPLGKVPALIREDAPALYDSRVITRFLDVRVCAGLYPEARLWDVLTLEATADGIMDSAVGMIYETRLRSAETVNPDLIEALWVKVSRAVTSIEARWISHLAGPLDMSHVAVACALGYLDFRHGGRDWQSANPVLTEWYARFAGRPAMQATLPQ